jgi:hypothetical protein
MLASVVRLHHKRCLVQGPYQAFILPAHPRRSDIRDQTGRVDCDRGSLAFGIVSSACYLHRDSSVT